MPIKKYTVICMTCILLFSCSQSVKSNDATKKEANIDAKLIEQGEKSIMFYFDDLGYDYFSHLVIENKILSKELKEDSTFVTYSYLGEIKLKNDSLKYWEVTYECHFDNELYCGSPVILNERFKSSETN